MALRLVDGLDDAPVVELPVLDAVLMGAHSYRLIQLFRVDLDGLHKELPLDVPARPETLFNLNRIFNREPRRSYLLEFLFDQTDIDQLIPRKFGQGASQGGDQKADVVHTQRVGHLVRSQFFDSLEHSRFEIDCRGDDAT